MRPFEIAVQYLGVRYTQRLLPLGKRQRVCSTPVQDEYSYRHAKIKSQHSPAACRGAIDDAMMTNDRRPRTYTSALLKYHYWRNGSAYWVESQSTWYRSMAYWYKYKQQPWIYVWTYEYDIFSHSSAQYRKFHGTVPFMNYCRSTILNTGAIIIQLLRMQTEYWLTPDDRCSSIHHPKTKIRFPLIVWLAHQVHQNIPTREQFGAVAAGLLLEADSSFLSCHQHS